MAFTNLIGKTISKKYQIKELIGQGGMAAVFLAHDGRLRRDIALKIISSEPALGDEQRTDKVERFLQEARTIINLVHPHIVQLYDADFDAKYNIYYIVMMLLKGGSLQDRIEQARQHNYPQVSLREVSQLVNQLAGALDYAHTQQILHRDLKSRNIMFDGHGNAYLVDFGIAKELDATSHMTASGIALGTITHMSPEQWMGKTLTGATDQYALAVVVYQLIAGHLPFEVTNGGNIRDQQYELMYKHLNNHPESLKIIRPDLPDAVIAVIEKGLAKDPLKRFESITIFAQALAEAIMGYEGANTGFFTFQLSAPYIPLQPITPVSGSQSTHHNPENRTRKILTIAVFLLVILGAIFGLILYGSRTKNEVTPTPSIVQSHSPEIISAQTEGGCPQFNGIVNWQDADGDISHVSVAWGTVGSGSGGSSLKTNQISSNQTTGTWNETLHLSCTGVSGGECRVQFQLFDKEGKESDLVQVSHRCP